MCRSAKVRPRSTEKKSRNGSRQVPRYCGRSHDEPLAPPSLAIMGERRDTGETRLTDTNGLAVERRELRSKALSIAVALIPFGLAFGISCADAGLTVWHAIGFSSLVFTGGGQFAAVGVLRDGGAPISAIASALLLGLRSLAYGVVMTPYLTGPRWKRAFDSQLMIDESVAIGTAAKSPGLVRYGYRFGGLSVFVIWNISTAVGALIGSNAGDLIEKFGIDAAIPASFLALVWPRLGDREQLSIAALGAIIAMVLIPIAPPGIPILASALASVLALRKQSGKQPTKQSAQETTAEVTKAQETTAEATSARETTR